MTHSGCGSEWFALQSRRDFAESERITVRPALGQREKEVLLTWFRCETKAGAARELFVTVNTVKKHIERVREKYNAAGRPAPTQALLLIRALQDGWFDIDALEPPSTRVPAPNVCEVRGPSGGISGHH